MVAEQHPSFAVEAAYLDKVVRVIDKEVASLQRLGWSGGANNAATFHLRDRAWKQADKLVDRRSSPYFGRIDVTDGGDRATYYIGMIGIHDSATGERAVIDWRAPVARPFYQPNDKTLLKRRLVIEECSLIEVFDDHVQKLTSTGGLAPRAIGLIDPSLEQFLARSRGQQLDQVVATIQGQQDELIRSDDKILLIQGGAGTGKTVVALHRLAYLLYRHRFDSGAVGPDQVDAGDQQPRQGDESARPDLNVAVFGPNRVFINFVSQVLPNLGEKEVLQTTFEDWFRDWCGAEAPAMPAHDPELEVTASTGPLETGHQANRRSRLKGSLRMGDLLDAYVRFLLKQIVDDLSVNPLSFMALVEFRPIQFRLPPALLRSTLEDNAGRPVKVIRELARRRCEAWIEAEIGRGLRERQGHGVVPRDVARGVLVTFRELFDRRWPSPGFAAAYRRLLRDEALCVRLARGWTRPEISDLVSGRSLGMEDLAPLAYMRLLFEGPSSRFDHVVVDEAQDVSPLQLRVLRAHCDDFTLIGDTGQGIFAHLGVRSWKESLEVFADARPSFKTLSQGYRSTHEITEFSNNIIRKASRELLARGVVFDAGTVRSFPRHGDPPLLQRASSTSDLYGKVGKFVDDSVAEGAQSVAIICRLTEQAEELYRELEPSLPLPCQAVLTRNDTVSAPIIFTSAYLAKGMEFDAVVVANANADEFPLTDHNARLLYTAVTRALHRLMIVWTGKLSSLIPLDS